MIENLTNEERERVYREVEREYRLKDAEKHLLEHFNFESSDEDLSCPELELKCGYSLEEAIDPESPNYILDYLVEAYEDAADCNVAENQTWDSVIEWWLGNLEN